MLAAQTLTRRQHWIRRLVHPSTSVCWNVKLRSPLETWDMSVNAPARPYSGTMDVDEFMAFLEMRPKEERWHLIEGIAVMMAPPSLAHQRIAWNLCELLNRGFAAQSRDLFAYHEIAI